MYNLEIKKSATKELSKLPKKEAIRIVEKLFDLKNNPRPDGCVKLASDKSEYRIRVGDYRVLYTIKDKLLIVFVFKIGNRKSIYKKKVNS